MTLEGEATSAPAGTTIVYANQKSGGPRVFGAIAIVFGVMGIVGNVQIMLTVSEEPLAVLFFGLGTIANGLFVWAGVLLAIQEKGRLGRIQFSRSQLLNLGITIHPPRRRIGRRRRRNPCLVWHSLGRYKRRLLWIGRCTPPLDERKRSRRRCSRHHRSHRCLVIQRNSLRSTIPPMRE